MHFERKIPVGYLIFTSRVCIVLVTETMIARYTVMPSTRCCLRSQCLTPIYWPSRCGCVDPKLGDEKWILAQAPHPSLPNYHFPLPACLPACLLTRLLEIAGCSLDCRCIAPVFVQQCWLSPALIGNQGWPCKTLQTIVTDRHPSTTRIAPLNRWEIGVSAWPGLDRDRS